MYGGGGQSLYILTIVDCDKDSYGDPSLSLLSSLGIFRLFVAYLPISLSLSHSLSLCQCKYIDKVPHTYVIPTQINLNYLP